MSFIINLPLFTVILGLVAVVLTSFLNGKISKIINIVVEMAM